MAIPSSSIQGSQLPGNPPVVSPESWVSSQAALAHSHDQSWKSAASNCYTQHKQNVKLLMWNTKLRYCSLLSRCLRMWTVNDLCLDLENVGGNPFARQRICILLHERWLTTTTNLTAGLTVFTISAYDSCAHQRSTTRGWSNMAFIRINK